MKSLIYLSAMTMLTANILGCATNPAPKQETPLVVDAHTFPQAQQAPKRGATSDVSLPFKPLTRDASDDTGISAIYDVRSESAREYQKLANSPELARRLAVGITLELLWQIAYARNAQLASARKQVAATERRYEQAMFLYNLSGQYAAFAREQSALNSTAGSMMSSSPIFPGALTLAGEVITSEVRMMQVQYAMAWRDLKSDIARTYHELYFIGRTINIAEEQVAILDTLEKIARDQFKSNMVSYSDVLKAQMAKAEIAADIGSYRSQETSLRQKLLAASNLPPETTLATPGASNWRLKESIEELRASAHEHRQELRMLALQIAKTEQMIALAKAQDNLYPAFTVGLSFIEKPMAEVGDTKSGMDSATTGLPKSTAFAEKPQVEPAASFAERTSYLAELAREGEAWRKRHENVLRETNAAIAEQYAMLESSQRYVKLYEESLIPLARETLQVTQLSYQSGKANFLDVLDAQRMLLKFRLEWQKNRRDYLVALAELERIVGKSLVAGE
jgi:outer membrane protein TolC